jgi:hypothetical protein
VSKGYMAGLVPAIHAPGLSVDSPLQVTTRGHVFDTARRGCPAQGRHDS